jgi:hypothetical protein
MKMIYWAIFCLLLFTIPLTYPARAAAGGVVIPPGFHKIESAVGIDLYKKDYPGGSLDYVQVIDLSQGASLKPMHGNIADPGQGKGVYGGNDARFRSQSLAAYWRELVAQDPSAFCVVNGQFFYMLEYPTRLPFPLKIDGEILTDGYGIKDFPDQKLMLELWPGKADIVALSKEALYSSSAPDIIAGLAEDAPKAKKRYTGRTFIGLTDPNGSGQFSTLMIFNTKTARQVDAAEVMKSFGAQKVMMLDGGGSTQLLCGGKSYVYSDRLVPQAIGILAGVPGKAPPAIDQAKLQAAVPAAPDAPNAATSAPGESTTTPENTPMPDLQPPQATYPSAPDQAKPAQQGQADGNIQPLIGIENQLQTQQKHPLSTKNNLRVLLPILYKYPSPIQEPAAKPGAVAVNPNLAAGNQIQGPLPTAIPSGNQPSTQTLSIPSIPGQTRNQPSQAALSASITPVHLDDVLWVPLSMMPVLMILLFGISKIRSREM